MASHTRLIVKLGSTYYRGAEAYKQMSYYAGGAVKTIDEAKAVCKMHNWSIWIIREPRSTKAKKSRYKTLCGCLGLHQKKGRKQNVPAQPGGAFGGQALAFHQLLQQQVAATAPTQPKPIQYKIVLPPPLNLDEL